MPKWTIRDPATFPILFADRTEEAYKTGDRQLLRVFKSATEAEAFGRRFRHWRYCLRQAGHRNSRCYDLEHSETIALSIDKVDYRTWEVYVWIKPNIERMLEESGFDVDKLLRETGFA